MTGEGEFRQNALSPEGYNPNPDQPMGNLSKENQEGFEMNSREEFDPNEEEIDDPDEFEDGGESEVNEENTDEETTNTSEEGN